ncbi:hypothetical protein [Deinococcus grandis]|uniref:hypothetical protein n=1 Tax=Deinococcus grandis TaxID=57498 RepID=UPI000A57B7B7|nr:hypothetical protein [Deinococcus grandis]
MSDLPQSLTASTPEQARLLLDPALLTPLGHLMRGEDTGGDPGQRGAQGALGRSCPPE